MATKKSEMSGKRAISSALIIFHLFAVGCATRPEQIPPAFVSAQDYEGMSCDEMHGQLRDVNGELAVLGPQQDSTATLDTTTFWVGMLLLWPVTFVPLFTDDQEPRISLLKGQQLALDNGIASNCKNRNELSGSSQVVGQR